MFTPARLGNVPAMTVTPEPTREAPADRFTLPISPNSPRQARVRLASRLASQRIEGEVAEVAALLTSELVTNAILHGRGEPLVEVYMTDFDVWVRVGDPDSRLPQLQQVDDGALGGRGMHLVACLADSWGADAIPGDGKTVWFRLRRDAAH